MQIIYDEQKAIQEKERIDAETPERNHKAKTRNRILAILTILLVAAIVLGFGVGMWYSLTLELGPLPLAWKILIILIISSVAVCVTYGLYNFYLGHLHAIMPAEDYYSPATQYHHAVENKKILNIETLGNPVWQITLVLEDEDHIVTKKEINLNFAYKTRTDISETIIDMDNEIVYTPYIEEKT